MRLYAAVGKALIEAKARAVDPFPEIEKLMTWEAFLASVEEAAKLAGPRGLRPPGLGRQRLLLHPPVRAGVPRRPSSSGPRRPAPLLRAIQVLRDMNARDARNVPKDAPTGFVRRRWKPHVFKGEEIDRRFYELCVLSELRNALRSGDLWVVGSRQFRDFEEYLLIGGGLRGDEAERSAPGDRHQLPGLPGSARDGLHETLTAVNALAGRGELPDASLADGVLKITPLTNAVPPEADALARRVSAMLPRIKITDLLVEVDVGRRSPSISCTSATATSPPTAPSC